MPTLNHLWRNDEGQDRPGHRRVRRDAGGNPRPCCRNNTARRFQCRHRIFTACQFHTIANWLVRAHDVKVRGIDPDRSRPSVKSAKRKDL
jgi:hypothetical protein